MRLAFCVPACATRISVCAFPGAMASAAQCQGRLKRGVATVQERWGHIDVLVNNGRYIGPGHMDRFMDAPVELIEKQIQANAISPIYLTKLVLPQMIARGHGNRQIARELAIGEQTVKTHVRSILTKLGLQDRVQAAIFALRHQADSYDRQA